MIKTYTFICENASIEFDDSKTVRELIDYAFDQLEYYEPAGMQLVTLFQCHHSKSLNGWFTRDTSRTCAEEIENPDELCFAYQMPDVFYFAEGGWGHHMTELGNHPIIPDPVDLKLRFEDFNNTIVINGQYTFSDIIKYLVKTEYIPKNSSRLLVHPIGISNGPLLISFDDAIMQLPLREFVGETGKRIDKAYPDHRYIYHEVYEILE